MSNIIELSRTLGHAIQKDPRYLQYQVALQANEDDPVVKELMETFEEARTALNTELQKPDKNNDKVKELDAIVRDTYAEIFNLPSVQQLSEAQQEFKVLLDHINQIITGSSQGVDPETIEYQEPCPPSGCSSCSGC